MAAASKGIAHGGRVGSDPRSSSPRKALVPSAEGRLRRRRNVSTPPSTGRRTATSSASGRASRKELHWYRPWKKVLDGSRRRRSGSSAASSTPRSTASTGTSQGPRENKAALIWEGEPGDQRALTYRELHREVCQFANVLEALGVEEGRPRRALPADGPGAADRDARLRPDRRDPLGRLRRLLAPSRCGTGSTTRAPRCWSRPTAAGAAASVVPLKADRRRGAAATRRRSRTSSSSSAHRTAPIAMHARAATTGGTT